jgi:hypothetical protein
MTLLSHVIPIDQATRDGGAQIYHDVLGREKVKNRRAVIELAKNRHRGCYTETSDLNRKNEHARQHAILKTAFDNDCGQFAWVERTGRLGRVLDGRR